MSDLMKGRTVGGLEATLLIVMYGALSIDLSRELSAIRCLAVAAIAGVLLGSALRVSRREAQRGIAEGTGVAAVDWVSGAVLFGISHGFAAPEALTLPTIGEVLEAVAIAVGEELPRAYVILTAREMFGSRALAWLVATVLFCSYHMYYLRAEQYLFFLIVALGGGALYSLYFVLRSNVLGLVVAHLVYNILCILLGGSE